jgi:hypothetical protein
MASLSQKCMALKKLYLVLSKEPRAQENSKIEYAPKILMKTNAIKTDTMSHAKMFLKTNELSAFPPLYY